MRFSLRWVLFSLMAILGGIGLSASAAALFELSAGVLILLLLATLCGAATMVVTVVVSRAELAINVWIATAIAALATVTYLWQVPWAFFPLQYGFADSFAMLAVTRVGAILVGASAGILVGRRLQSTRPILSKSLWFFVAMLVSTGLISFTFQLLSDSPRLGGLIVVFVLPIIGGLVTQLAAPTRQSPAIGLGTCALMAMAIREYNAAPLIGATCFMFLLSVLGSRIASKRRGLTDDLVEPTIPEVRVAE